MKGKYRAREKKYWKSRRDGLVEVSAATGEKRRLSETREDTAYRPAREQKAAEPPKKAAAQRRRPPPGPREGHTAPLPPPFPKRGGEKAVLSEDRPGFPEARRPPAHQNGEPAHRPPHTQAPSREGRGGRLVFPDREREPGCENGPARPPVQAGPDAPKREPPSRRPGPDRKTQSEAAAAPNGAEGHGGSCEKAGRRPERAGKRWNAAREETPKKHTAALMRKSRLRLKEEERVPGALTRMGRASVQNAVQTACREIYGTENGDTDAGPGPDAGRMVEIAGKAARTAGMLWERHGDAPFRGAARREQAFANAEAGLRYRRMLRENPECAGNPAPRLMKKERMKRRYRKAARNAARQAEKAAKKAGTLSCGAARDTARTVLFAVRHKGLCIAAALLALLFLCAACLQSCSALLAGGGMAAVLAAYPADDTEIRDADLLWTRMELELDNTVSSIREDYPGYDEYRVNADPVEHNPFALAGYLSAMYGGFRFRDIEGDIRALFQEQYRLKISPETEIRYKTVHHTDPETGETHTEKVPYEYHILNVRLQSKQFSEIIAPRLRTKGTDDLYDVYMKTLGAHQRYGNPFEGACAGRISGLYGYRNGPDGGEGIHRGLDFACTPGEPVRALRDGVVTEAGGDCLTISDERGRTFRYEYCADLLVGTGDAVKRGGSVARAGTRLHLEIEEKGESLNPYFLIDLGGPDSGAAGDAGDSLHTGAFEAVRAEGEKYIGMPYVWGGSSPETGFDCSGFVCWVYTHAGVKNIPRTTAQGLYNQCTPVTSPKPGDLVFFTNTYGSPNPVTHVGIYTGANRMLHCGDPIGYANMNTSYWQGHFYAFGRLSGIADSGDETVRREESDNQII